MQWHQRRKDELANQRRVVGENPFDAEKAPKDEDLYSDDEAEKSNTDQLYARASTRAERKEQGRNKVAPMQDMQSSASFATNGHPPRTSNSFEHVMTVAPPPDYSPTPNLGDSPQRGMDEEDFTLDHSSVQLYNASP
jgi:hypothetical protein